MNEQGLSANLVYLYHTSYEQRDARPALSNLLWAQWVLDNFATVAETLAGMGEVQVASTSVADREWPLYLSIADASGDSAIIDGDVSAQLRPVVPG